MPRGKPVRTMAVDPMGVYVDRRQAAELAGSTLAEIEWLIGVRRLRPAFRTEGLNGNKSTLLLYRLDDVMRAVEYERQEERMTTQRLDH